MASRDNRDMHSPERITVRSILSEAPSYRPAMALVLSGSPTFTEDVRAQVLRLRALAEAQKLGVDLLVGAFRSDELVTAAFVIESPGRTALVYTPTAIGSAEEGIALGAALAEIQSRARGRGSVLMQALLPKHDNDRPRVFSEAGFSFLAELIYLERPIALDTQTTRRSRPLEFCTYAPKRRGLFERALEASYADSKDCPGLGGLRRTVDILAGHMATGVYDPEGWFVALANGEPAGVILTADVPHRTSLEVVYMGVADQARGQGVGNALLHRAVAWGTQRGRTNITLAVDSINEPARRLYERWGFLEVMRRRAWISRLLEGFGAGR